MASKYERSSYALKESTNLKSEDNRGPAYEFAEDADFVYSDGKIVNIGIYDLNKLKKAGEPFFLAFGFMKPHLPFNTPTKYWNMYDENTIDLSESYLQPKSISSIAFHNSGELRVYYGIPKKGDLSKEIAIKIIHGCYACVSYLDAQIGCVR